MPSLLKRSVVELIGTFWLVFAGCGSAIFSATFPGLGIGILGVALAFGLSVVTMAYALGHVSGAHLNPAVTAGLVAARKFPRSELVPYIVGQVIGAILAAVALYVVASGRPGFSLQDGFATNGFGVYSPAGFSMLACFISEFVLTGMFMLVILGVTSQDAPKGFAPLAIGLTLILIHLISIPITNTSVNPARSTGPAIILGGEALRQLWFFWVSPLLGAVTAGVSYRKWIQRPAYLAEVPQPERPLKKASSH